MFLFRLFSSEDFKSKHLLSYGVFGDMDAGFKGQSAMLNNNF